VRVEGISSSSGGTAIGVRFGDGTRIEADAVVAGIGAVPRIGLAADAGLEVADGIVTTAALRTSDPDIFAAGDVASAYHPLLGRHIRVEHWANALKQPAVAAAAMLGQDAMRTCRTSAPTSTTWAWNTWETSAMAMTRWPSAVTSTVASSSPSGSWTAGS